MHLAFGKAVGTAARVEANQKIMTVYSTPQYLEKIKDALHHAGYKLPTPSHLKTSVLKVAAESWQPQNWSVKSRRGAQSQRLPEAEPAKGAEAAKGGAKGAKGAAPKAGEAAKGAAAPRRLTREGR